MSVFVVLQIFFFKSLYHKSKLKLSNLDLSSIASLKSVSPSLFLLSKLWIVCLSIITKSISQNIFVNIIFKKSTNFLVSILLKNIMSFFTIRNFYYYLKFNYYQNLLSKTFLNCANSKCDLLISIVINNALKNQNLSSTKLCSTLKCLRSVCLKGTLLLWFSSCFLLPSVSAVTVTEVHIMSIASGRTDYVIQGESVQLSCHYIFNRPYERVIAVNWKKDGREVYFSTPNKRPIALSIFRGHVDFNTADLLNTVTLINIDKSFAGQYSCRVITEFNESENTAQMTVIVDACRDSNWRTRTDMVNCVEEISFHCVGMYPKPSPACSIHNDKTDQYFAGEMFDMIQPLPNGTYEIAIQRRYSVANFTDYPGELSFHCHLLVLMTSWRMGIKYKLFGDAGCVTAPPPIENGTFNMIGENTCWGTPRENSRVTYSCIDGYHLMGPSVLYCRNGSWVPDPINLMSQPVNDMRSYSTLRLPMPYCAIRNFSSATSTLSYQNQIILLFQLIIISLFNFKCL